MSNKSKHGPEYSLAQLTLNLRGSEAIRGAVSAISATENNHSKYTAADHDYQTSVPASSLRVSLDPDGNAQPPNGSALVVRGTAWIENEENKVALFRV